MMYSTEMRYCGLLLHPTSLPGPYGIGDLGPGACRFVDFLEQCGVSLWQILPLGPTGFGNSPYAARSSFAGNELLLSPELLAREGWLSEEEIAGLSGMAPGRVDYGLVEERKLPLLKRAADRCIAVLESRPSLADAFRAFCKEEAHWLDDYALFMCIYEQYRDARWQSLWDTKLARRDPVALRGIGAEKAREIIRWKMLQFFFENQWNALHAYAFARGIRIVGDIPIFVAPDSVDAWTNIDLFQTDGEGRYLAVSGVPPDYFSATGQLWGNPVYDWDAMRKDGYRWWKRRIGRLLRQVDIFRIDHFRGFDAYWAVPGGDPTAEHGRWVSAPGQEFFTALREEFGPLPVFAEDLGFMTDGVKRLRDEQGFPGMKVCQFGFEDMKEGKLDTRHLFLPHNYPYHCVAYSGTHDNDTIAGWFGALSPADKKTVAAYFNCTGDTLAWAMIRAVMASRAEYAIFPFQDLLGLGAEARMNTPATCGPENWSWRLREEPSPLIARAMAELVWLYARNYNRFPDKTGAGPS
jgi:4-alpha-glucanotransferase